MFKTTTKECYRFQIPASGSRPRPVAHICLLQAVVLPTDDKGNATGAGCLLDLTTSVAAFPQLTFEDVCQKLKVDKALKTLCRAAPAAGQRHPRTRDWFAAVLRGGLGVFSAACGCLVSLVRSCAAAANELHSNVIHPGSRGVIEGYGSLLTRRI